MELLVGITAANTFAHLDEHYLKSSSQVVASTYTIGTRRTTITATVKGAGP